MNLRALVGKVNDTTRGVLEAAAGLCLARTHYDIEIEHFLLKLMDVPDGDFAAILKAFSVDKSRLAGEINRSLDKLKSGNARTPAFSPTLVDMIREGWVVGSLEFGAAEIRSGFTILALVSNDDLARIAREIGKELQKIEPERFCPLEGFLGVEMDRRVLLASSRETSDHGHQRRGQGGRQSGHGASGRRGVRSRDRVRPLV